MDQYTVTGMSCAACSARVEKAVSAVPGVTACSVNLLTHSMGVEGSASPAAVMAAVKRAGYGARPQKAHGTNRSLPSAQETPAEAESAALMRRLTVSLGFLLLLMYLSMGHTMLHLPLPAFLHRNAVACGLTQLLLAGAVLVINQKFFLSGVKSMWRLAPNMDALVALGSAAAFGYSVCALFVMIDAQQRGDTAAVTAWGHDLYFESAAMIPALITLGKWLEARSKGKTTDALRALISLAPKTAAVLRDGQEVILPVEQVRPGDVVAVRPGETIPVDGVVQEGGGAVNQAALTGESVPVDKQVGDFVSAGTLNQSGYLRCQATRVGEDTTLSRIIRMVSDAAATKAPIAKIADKVSGVFVPAVVAMALITVAVWLALGQTVGFALARGISVLVISCPCALGLATPVAIMVGSGVGAKKGILFKTAASLEIAGKTKIVVLDKTGTVTRGEPQVTDLWPAENIDEATLLRLACALEQKSEHPLAKAVVRQGEQAGVTPPEVTGFAAHPGSGLTAVWNGKTLAGGNAAFIARFAPFPAQVKDMTNAWAEQGKTPLYFACDGAPLGAIAVADVLKDDSAAAVQELRRMGLRVVMLTGDNAVTAAAIGRAAGVDEVIAGVLPDEKEGTVRDLQRDGGVMMVGDGINDAPALTRADVGVAIGAGTDVAIDAADVVLMNSRLSDVPAAISLSRAVLRNIHENLFWAFFYNAVGIPLAAGAFIAWLGWQLNPMFAAAAMSLSSFCVVTNALRLNRLKRQPKPKG